MKSLKHNTMTFSQLIGPLSIALLLTGLPQVTSLGESCNREGWSCNGGRSRYCDCRPSSSYSSSSSQQSQCNRYGRYTVDEVCIHGCHNGKCMAENEVCGTSWAVNGVPTLDYNSPVCPLNDIILDYNWKTWENIQGDATVTSNYLVGVESDIAWFNRNMDWLFVPNGNSSSDYVNDTKPPELEAIQDQCQDIYEKFSCMRNLPECSDDGVGSKGHAQLEACVQACESVSSRCFAEFEIKCKAMRADYATRDERANFTCSSLRELECWDPYCIQHPIGEGEDGLGWERDCKYMCQEFQQEKEKSEEEGSAVVGIVIAVVFLVIIVLSVVACCFCCPGCPGYQRRYPQVGIATHNFIQPQPAPPMATPAQAAFYPTPEQYHQQAPQNQQTAPYQYQQPAPSYQQQPHSQYHQPPPTYQPAPTTTYQTPPGTYHSATATLSVVGVAGQPAYPDHSHTPVSKF